MRLRCNVSQYEYCPWCQNEGWVWLTPERFRYHDMLSVAPCRWCEEGDRLQRKYPWIVKDYRSDEVDVGSIDIDKRHILRPDELQQLDRMLRAQRPGGDPPDRPAFVQPTLGVLDP